MQFAGNKDLEERFTRRERVFDGYILHIDHAEVTLPNGQKAMREIANHIGASAVLPVDDNGMVTLVRQYRAPVEKVLLEIPAGKLDAPGEDRLAAAQRELQEETGLTAQNWIHLTDIATTPGFSSEIISLYLARQLSKGETHPDEDEFLSIVTLPFADAVSMALSGEITDAKTICALLMAGQDVNGGKHESI